MNRLLIYDDVPQHSQELAGYLKNMINKTAIIDIAENIDDAMRLLEENAYTCCFLDIELDGGKNGIDIGSMIRQKYKQTSLVYITAFIKYCEEIFVTSPDALLIKPFSEEAVKRTLDIIKSKQKEGGTVSITVSKNTVETIDLENISSIETSSRKLIFYGLDRRPLYEYYNKKLSDISDKLPEWFVVCHKSICVNMRCVRRIERYFFVMDDDREIPISQSRFNEAKLKYLEFLGERL